MISTKISRLVPAARQRLMLRGLQARVGIGLEKAQTVAKAAKVASDALNERFKTEQLQSEHRWHKVLVDDIRGWDHDLDQAWATAEKTAWESLRKVAEQSAAIRKKLDEQIEQEKKAFQNKSDQLAKDFENAKLAPGRKLEAEAKQLEQSLAETLETYRKIELLMTQRSQAIPAIGSSAGVSPFDFRPPTVADVLPKMAEQNQKVRYAYDAMNSHALARLAASAWVWFLAILIGVAIGIILVVANLGPWWMGAIVGTAVIASLAGAILFQLRPILHRITQQHFPDAQNAVITSEAMVRVGKQIADQNCKHELARLGEEYRHRCELLHTEHLARLEALQKSADDRIIRLEQEQREIRTSAASQRKKSIEQTNETRTPAHEKLRFTVDEERKKFLSQYEAQNQQLLAQHSKGLEYYSLRLKQGSESVKRYLRELTSQFQSLFPAWDDPIWSEETYPRTNHQAVIPFGTMSVDIGPANNLNLGQPIERVSESMPLAFHLVEQGSMWIEADTAAHADAMALVRELILRGLTSLPAGSMQITVIDPIGLGQDFGWLMQLADTDPKMVSHRVWTQPAHIAEQLARLTHHTENVIQQLLRDRYRDIRAYNAEAGSMAEPYHVIVWSQFPYGIDDHSWKSLSALLAAGGRCGVASILIHDPQIPFPPTVEKSQLANVRLRIRLRSNVEEGIVRKSVVVDDPVLERFPVQLHTPPTDDIQNRILTNCAKAALAAGHVEVPFETIVPKTAPLGKASSATGLEIPIGQSGIGRAQTMRLGSGTSQHVLIAGKTGSGKSSLLHTLITSAALKYAPDQLRLVLLDFKKGVEFQSYAEQHLTHADIIGIESQREFGLSTLEYLDRVMQKRGELFRQESVQDVPSWARKHPQRPLPRILIVVDEFQEIFVEDDKLAQQAAMLLDRIVRQGRSFGMHVVLASQTLGGAYSLPRTTLAQMAVRIALQCEGSDAMIILNEDNLAAERLRFSGQAIYNDASGRIEGNQPFQVAYLSKEKQIERLSALEPYTNLVDAASTGLGRQVIFEGHRSATWDGPSIQSTIDNVQSKERDALVCVLGESVSIEPPVAVALTRQAGRNAVIVGNEESNVASCLLSMFATGVHSQAGRGAGSLDVHYFDGSRPDDTNLASLPKILQKILPTLVVTEPRRAADAIAALGQDLENRLADPDASHPPRLVIISQLGRFRDFRRGDEFAFGNDDSTKSPDAWFQALLRDGPSVGIHCILHVDNANTLSRWLPRQSLHDLELRLLMQMSGNDSNQLIDSPAANRLNAHVMLIHDEATGRDHKFRPYRLDDANSVVQWAKSKRKSK